LPGVMLSLLGPPTLLVSGGAPVVPQPGSKALALLAYLVMEPHPHSRETLAALLWGESPEHEARASLRQALKQLRTGLGELVQGDRRLIELAEPVECDAEQFRRRVTQEPIVAATTEVPRFLEGFSVRHAPRFEEWAAETRSALLLQYTTALGILVARLRPVVRRGGEARCRVEVSRGESGGGAGPLRRIPGAPPPGDRLRAVTGTADAGPPGRVRQHSDRGAPGGE
jgi:hypothetical protein